MAEWLVQEEITIYISASPLFRSFAETLIKDYEFPSVRIVRLASQTVFPSDVDLYRKHLRPFEAAEAFNNLCLVYHRMERLTRALAC